MTPPPIIERGGEGIGGEGIGGEGRDLPKIRTNFFWTDRQEDRQTDLPADGHFGS